MNLIFSNFLKNEMQKWQDNKIIDSENIAKLQDFYKFENLQTPKFSIVIFGYLFFGLALITLIGANWEEIPKTIRLILVLGIMILVQFYALISYKKGENKKAISLFFLGNLCFGASIALISQIYHLGGNTTDLFFWWSFGTFLVAACFCEKYLTLQTLCLATIYLFLNQNHISIFYLAIIFFTTFVSIKEKSQFLFILAILGFYCWIFQSFIDENMKFVVFAVPAVILFYMNSLKNINFIFAPKLYELSILLSVIFLIILHIPELYGFVAKYPMPLFVNLFIIATILPIFYIGIKEQNYLKIALLVVFCVVILSFNKEDVVAFKILISTISVIYAIRLILKKWIKLGFILLLAVATIRYFDLVHDYIGTSLLFMFFGILMIVVSKRMKNEN